MRDGKRQRVGCCAPYLLMQVVGPPKEARAWKERKDCALPPPPSELSVPRKASRGCPHVLRVCVDTAVPGRCRAAQQRRLAVPLVGRGWWSLRPFVSSAGVLRAVARPSVIALLLLPSAVRDCSVHRLQGVGQRRRSPPGPRLASPRPPRRAQTLPAGGQRNHASPRTGLGASASALSLEPCS